MKRLAYWLAMALIDGLDLAAHLTRATLEWRQQRAWRATSGAITTKEETK